MLRRTLGVLWLAALAAAAQAPDPQAQKRNGYVLGPDDQITIRVLDAEEIDGKPVRLDSEGFIRLPLVGNVRATGLTLDQLEAELVRKLKTYIKEPQVAVSVTEFRSLPVSVLGAVRSPGVQQIRGQKTLLELLAIAGGIDPEAGHSVKITRRKEYGPIPLKGAAPDPSGEYFLADLDLSTLLAARNPQDNIEVKPYDIVTIPRGELVYVMGQVKRPGGFVLHQQESLSALQALALAEGLDRTAKPQDTRILRTVSGSPSRTEIKIDLKKILMGKSGDVALLPNDILFIPNNVPKSAMIRGLESALQIGTGIAIYRVP